MAKISIDTRASHVSRGESMTVAQALKYIRTTRAGDEDEPMSESDAASYAVVYAARRMMALAKDQSRVDSGKRPTRIYTPRVAQVKGVKPAALKHRDEAKERLSKDLGLVPAKAPKAVKTRKVA